MLLEETVPRMSQYSEYIVQGIPTVNHTMCKEIFSDIFLASWFSQVCTLFEAYIRC